MQPSVREIKTVPTDLRASKFTTTKAPVCCFMLTTKTLKKMRTQDIVTETGVLFYAISGHEYLLKKDENIFNLIQWHPKNTSTQEHDQLGDSWQSIWSTCRLRFTVWISTVLTFSALCSLCVNCGPAPVRSCSWYLLISADAVTTN